MQQFIKTKEDNLVFLPQVEEDGAGDGGRGEGEGAGHGGAQDQEDTAHDCVKVSFLATRYFFIYVNTKKYNSVVTNITEPLLL